MQPSSIPAEDLRFSANVPHPTPEATRARALDALYATGHWLLSRERVHDAASVFRGMAVLAPDDERAWLALGACHEALKQTELALENLRGGPGAQPARGEIAAGPGAGPLAPRAGRGGGPCTVWRRGGRGDARRRDAPRARLERARPAVNITADATRGPAGGATTAALEATGAVGSSPATVRTEGGGGGSLLPEPGAGGLDGIQDAMSMMYELVARQGEMSLESGETAVDAGARAEQVTGERQDAAIEQEEADEAKMNSHGFLADLESLAPKIAEYLGIAAAAVGAAALTVASCGTGGIAVAAVVVAVSATGMVASDTHCFGKDSAYIGLGLELTGAVFSLGASSGMVASGALQTVSAVADGASGAADVVAGASAQSSSGTSRRT